MDRWESQRGGSLLLCRECREHSLLGALLCDVETAICETDSTRDFSAGGLI